MFSDTARDLVQAHQLKLMGLTFGPPVEAMRPTLAALQLEARSDPALLAVAGLWLYHDFFDESHAIAQDISSLEGSYWHAIQHRREPDYGNAKYWLRRVGRHPIHEALALEVAKIENGPVRTWDAFTFVDHCERHADEGVLIEIQHAEWRLLFDYCLNQI